GLLVVPAASTLAFLHPQPVSALLGVGPKTEEELGRLGLRTVGDVAGFPLGALARSIGTVMAEQLHELSWGRDPRSVTPERHDKSVGHETT
ncbi:hypothetical protein QR504_25570, partial [Escherichia coli]|uniref:DNA polymerase thumb domain-containing protein n=1 Tax=Escherichia coli TaxID=562 RepID=UPI002739353D